MIEVSMTFLDTDTSQTVTVPLRNFAVEPLTEAKFNRFALACYMHLDEERPSGATQMDDLSMIAQSTYAEAIAKFRRFAVTQAPIESLGG